MCCSGAFGLSLPLAHLFLSEVSYPIWKELCLQGCVCVCVSVAIHGDGSPKELTHWSVWQ